MIFVIIFYVERIYEIYYVSVINVISLNQSCDFLLMNYTVLNLPDRVGRAKVTVMLMVHIFFLMGFNISKSQSCILF